MYRCPRNGEVMDPLYMLHRRIRKLDKKLDVCIIKELLEDLDRVIYIVRKSIELNDDNR